MAKTTQEQLITLLTAAFSPVKLEVINESHKHAGHAGVAGDESGETHFHVVIVSDAFAGMSRVQCHQAIYMAVGELMNNPIHALSLDAKAS